MAVTQYQGTLEKSNFNHLVMDIAWFGLALAATTRFLQFYAIRLGATPMDLGWLSALPAAILVIATSLGHWWRQRHNDSVDAVWLPSIGFRLVFLLPAFAPFFPESLRVPWVIAAAALPALPQAIVSATFLVMMRETVSQERLTPLYTRRALVMNIAITIGALGFGLLLETLPFPVNYQIMFVIAFAFAMASQWHLGRLRVILPAPPPADGKKRSVRELLRDERFQSVMFVTVLAYLGFTSIFALIPLQLESGLGATEGFMAMFGIAELLSGAIAASVVGRFIQRYGSRSVIAFGMVGTGIAAFIIGVAPELWVTLIGAMFTGASWTAASVAVLAFFSERTEPGDMAATQVFHQFLFAAMFVGPLVGSSLVNSGLEVAPVIIGGAFLRVIVGILAQQGLTVLGKRRVQPIR